MLLQEGCEWLGWEKARNVPGIACPDAPCHRRVSPHGAEETLAASLLPSPKRRPM